MAKKFSTIELFYDLKLLGEYDVKSGKFNKSFKFYIRSYLLLLVVCIFATKMIYIYLKISSEDKIDNEDSNKKIISIILIGDLFYNFNPIAKFWVTILAVTANLWFLFIQQTYLYLNSKKENLLLYWLKLIHELKPEKENNFDKKFFEQTSELNYKLDFIFKLSAKITSTMIAIPYALLCIKVNTFGLYFLIILHYFIFSALVWNTIKISGNISLIIMTILIYFKKKFEILKKKIKKTKDDNLRLLKLIENLNQLNHKIHILNLYFNYVFGFNFIFTSLIAVIVPFLCFSVNNYFFRIGVSGAITILFIINIFIPYYLSTSIQKQIKKCKNLFRKFLFKPKIKLNLKIAIKSLIEDDNSKFKCFTLFDLSTYNAYQATINVIINILLLLRIYYVQLPKS